MLVNYVINYEVASFTDAWIETEVIQRLYVFLPVASFTDAWIETILNKVLVTNRKSHLLQMRGLKQGILSALARERGVASFTDAWIETACHRLHEFGERSHLLQMRGLKHHLKEQG